MIHRIALLALWGASRTLAQNGCLDPLDANFDPAATSDDGTSCAVYCSGDLGDALETEMRPRWVTGEVDGTNLHLVVQANQRYAITWLSLVSPNTLDNANPTKRFRAEFIDHGRVANTPGSPWTTSYSLEQCWNEYDFTSEWFTAYLPANMEESSLMRTDFPGTVIFSGWVEVYAFEDIEDIRDVNLTRWHTAMLRVDIIFRTTVAVTSGEVDVLDEYNVMFAIIEQATIIVDPTSDPPEAEADVVLFTTIQWPYELRNPQISVADPLLTAAIELLEDCEDPGVTQGAQAADNGVQACNRRFHIDVTMLGDKCDFTGDYTAMFDVVCADSVDTDDCPLRGGETTQVTFNLESEHVCPAIVENVGAVAYSNTYGVARTGTDAYDPADLMDGFLVMQRAYYEVGVNVVDGDDSWIEETIITSIDLCMDIACASPTPLYAKGDAPSPDTFYQPLLMMQIENYPADPTSPLPRFSDFSFVLHPSVFPVPLDTSLTFHLKVGLDVTYLHTADLLEEVGEAGEKKALPKPAKTVQEHVRNIRLGSDSLRHAALAEEHPAAHKLRLLQDTRSNMDVTATGQVLPNPEDYPDAGSASDGGDIHTRASSALRRAETSSLYMRILVSVVMAVLMTALAM